MKRVKTAIAGCGKVGHMHAQALKNIPEADFTAVCGRDIGKTRIFAEKYKVKAYSNIEEMADSGVEAVIICTPHPNHMEAAVKAARAGMHVLVEKPLASSLEDCDAIIDAARDNRVVLGTVCQRRFYTPVQRVKKAIDEGKIGRPVLGTVNMLGWRDETYYKSDPWRGTWRGEGGGVLVNQAPHQLDLLQWFMGPIDELFDTGQISIILTLKSKILHWLLLNSRMAVLGILLSAIHRIRLFSAKCMFTEIMELPSVFRQMVEPCL